MSFSPARPARAAIFVAALVLTAVTAFGNASGGHPALAPSPSPSGPAAFLVKIHCPQDNGCQGGGSFICAGGTDCGVWLQRLLCRECALAIVQYDIRVFTVRDPEVLTGRLVFEPGQTATTLSWRPTASVTSIYVQLSIDGVVVHQQRLTP